MRLFWEFEGGVVEVDCLAELLLLYHALDKSNLKEERGGKWEEGSGKKIEGKGHLLYVLPRFFCFRAGTRPNSRWANSKKIETFAIIF